MEERISELKDRNTEYDTGKGGEKTRIQRRIKKKILWQVLSSIKKGNIKIIGISEGEEREKGAENLLNNIWELPISRERNGYRSPWS